MRELRAQMIRETEQGIGEALRLERETERWRAALKLVNDEARQWQAARAERAHRRTLALAERARLDRMS
jgi:hypothetical protein